MATAILDVMTKDPVAVEPHDSAADAARSMRADNIGALPVTENGRLLGMVTDRDIVMRALEKKISRALCGKQSAAL